MKIDVRDPRYKHERDSGTVYLNGEIVKDAVAFDDVEGWVERLARDERGKAVIDWEREEVMRERLTGTVRYVPTNVMVY